MAQIDSTKIQKIFDYVYSPTSPLTKANGNLVFGRWDPLVAQRAGEIYKQGLVDYSMFVGGIGKDSGVLTQLNLPEATWQAALGNIFYGIPANTIYTEPRPTNGGEAARMVIEDLVELESNKGLKHDGLIILIHPTASRRMRAIMDLTRDQKGFNTSYQNAGSNYIFNSKNPVDQKEAVMELVKLADWPAKNWCAKQNDLPEDLVAYAKEVLPVVTTSDFC
ncbi:MAG: hypothetical protein WC548_03705 [Candidatus Pacearchaeota archaeon]